MIFMNCKYFYSLNGFKENTIFFFISFVPLPLCPLNNPFYGYPFNSAIKNDYERKLIYIFVIIKLIPSVPLSWQEKGLGDELR